MSPGTTGAQRNYAEQNNQLIKAENPTSNKPDEIITVELIFTLVFFYYGDLFVALVPKQLEALTQ